jgi:hypothetical protein
LLACSEGFWIFEHWRYKLNWESWNSQQTINHGTGSKPEVVLV